ncbi:unnamed protein product [Owenia fusiformis]|uniref:Uncharacterized protein n=1 Tax=Owenia fusiformis TaxID=6347 RepID=A0A8J1UNU5_OWEFU|nr:unnamed protein product [Owenia fusiformis]
MSSNVTSADTTGSGVTTAPSPLGSTTVAPSDSTVDKFFLGLTYQLIVICAIGFNIILLLIFLRVKRFRTPAYWLLLDLAITDILAAFFWTLPTMVSAVGSSASWVPTEGFCKFQGFFCTAFFCHNMLTVVCLAFERVLKLVKPSKWEELFTSNTVVLLIIFNLWVYSIVMSIYPLIGWGAFTYFEGQKQCSFDFEKSVSHLNFLFITSFVFPVLVGFICHYLIKLKLRFMKKRVVPGMGEKMVIEENKEAPMDSYAAKLKKQQNKFKLAGMKKNKPTVGKKSKRKGNDDGYASDSSMSSSDEEDKKKVSTVTRNDQKKDEDFKPKRKRVHVLTKSDISLARTYFIVWLVFSLIWLFYFVINYIYTYSPTTALPDGFLVAAVWFTHITTFIKPLIFLTHGPFRKSTADALSSLKSCKCIKKQTQEEKVKYDFGVGELGNFDYFDEKRKARKTTVKRQRYKHELTPLYDNDNDGKKIEESTFVTKTTTTTTTTIDVK